jgi:hypothetical protein
LSKDRDQHADGSDPKQNQAKVEQQFKDKVHRCRVRDSIRAEGTKTMILTMDVENEYSG